MKPNKYVLEKAVCRILNRKFKDAKKISITLFPQNFRRFVRSNTDENCFLNFLVRRFGVSRLDEIQKTIELMGKRYNRLVKEIKNYQSFVRDILKQLGFYVQKIKIK